MTRPLAIEHRWMIAPGILKKHGEALTRCGRRHCAEAIRTLIRAKDLDPDDQIVRHSSRKASKIREKKQ